MPSLPKLNSSCSSGALAAWPSPSRTAEYTIVLGYRRSPIASSRKGRGAASTMNEEDASKGCVTHAFWRTLRADRLSCSRALPSCCYCLAVAMHASSFASLEGL
jgi:hypothetical protein